MLDVLTNSLGAWLGALAHDRLSKQSTFDARLVGRLSLELPLMGLVYLLVPLLSLASLAHGSERVGWLLVRLAAAKLRRGAKVIIETINPDTFAALRWFWMDPTHRQPVSPAMLRFLLEDAGFTMLDVLYSSPVHEEEALQRLPERTATAPTGSGCTATIATAAPARIAILRSSRRRWMS